MGFLIFMIIYLIMCGCQVRDRNATAAYYNKEAQKYYAIGDYAKGDLYTDAAVRAKNS